MKDIVFVTGNQNKADRYGKMIARPVEHVKLDLEEMQSTSLEDIAEYKAKQAYEKIGRPVMVEDVGLFFNALGDVPGPFIKFFVEQENGLEHLCRMLDGFSDRTAYTKIVLCYFDGKKVTFFKGSHSGTIAKEPRGTGGFGYDAIWCIDGYGGRTRAELTDEEDQQTYNSIRPIEEMKEFFND